MNMFVNALTTDSVTENGAKTYTTSLNKCLDLFFRIGALRGKGNVMLNDFEQAFKEDPEIATRIALWARDRENGAGERQSFRLILEWLEVYAPHILSKVIGHVPELGRWDDLIVFKSGPFREIALAMYAYALNDGNGLAAKWAPRENARDGYKQFGRDLAAFMGLSPREYRKLIVSLSNTVEQKMCAKNWDEIEYSHVPSIAHSKLASAFKKHSPERYANYIAQVEKGEKKINANVIYPHLITKMYNDPKTADVMWKVLPDFVKTDKTFIPIVDVSSSMSCSAGEGGSVTCMDVSVALGLYLAERNKSAFKNLAITFETNPSFMIKEDGVNIVSMANKWKNASWGGSTNLEAAFRLVLNHAIKNGVKPSDMPDALIVLSDMEFNSYGNGTDVSTMLKDMFANSGYAVPQIVWWNLHARNSNVPVRHNEKGMALVSGFSPSSITTVLSGETPIEGMMNTIMVDRYDFNSWEDA